MFYMIIESENNYSDYANTIKEYENREIFRINIKFLMPTIMIAELQYKLLL